MNCPQCGRANAERYKGEAAHKLNTVMCAVCGRVPLPVLAPEPEEEEIPPAEPAEKEAEPEETEPSESEPEPRPVLRGRRRNY